MRTVQPAHMELAEPSIATAFDACVAAGATTVVVAPYFLGPGRHWDSDIPALAAAAAAVIPGSATWWPPRSAPIPSWSTSWRSVPPSAWPGPPAAGRVPARPRRVPVV